MDLLPRPDDHEAKMARADLFKLAQYSFKLFKMIHEDQELEGWVQAKVTKAADYIASVYHYMEYEMKFSEYGEKLENSDVYSESQKRAIQGMLTEAKATMKKLTAAQAKKLKKKGSKVDEAAKPDFADLDDDGDEQEPMKKAAKDAKKSDKKVKEGFPTVADAKARHEKEKGTGKFDKKQISTGTVYTKKATKDVDDEDDTPKKNKKVKEAEGRLTFTQTPDGKTAVKSSTGRVQATMDQGKTTYAPGKPQGSQSAQPTPDEKPVKETSKKRANKDYDGDGKIESPKDEVWGSRAKAAAKSGKAFSEAAKCNHSNKGKSCPVHGMKECGGMYEEERKAAIKPSKGLSAAKKSSIVKKAKSGADIGKPGKGFAALASKAGGGEKGKKIAAAAMWKNAPR